MAVLRRVDNQCQKVSATTFLFRPCPILSHCQKMAFDWHNLESNRNRPQAMGFPTWICLPQASQSLLILHSFGILLGWTPNHWPTLLTHVLHG